MKRHNSSFFTDDKIYSFVDGRTTAEEDRMFIARMAKDREFANMIEDLIDAVNAIEEANKTDVTTSFDYSKTALAAFCYNDANAESNLGNDITAGAFIAKKAENMADDFLNSLEENETEEK